MVRQNRLPPNFNNSFHYQKKTRNKAILFPEVKKLVSTSQNEGLAEVPVEGKTASTSSNSLLSEKMEENCFHEPENQFSLVELWHFFKN